MARHIDIDKLAEMMCAKADTLLEGKQAFNYAAKWLDLLPAADVAEVKHGEWKEYFAFGAWHYDCPFCDDGYATKEKDKSPPNYCQNCGAKMDGGKAE